MDEATQARIDNAIAVERAKLQRLLLHEVGEEFEQAFGIRPDARGGKDDLIERILAKARAALERNA